MFSSPTSPSLLGSHVPLPTWTSPFWAPPVPIPPAGLPLWGADSLNVWVGARIYHSGLAHRQNVQWPSHHPMPQAPIECPPNPCDGLHAGPTGRNPLARHGPTDRACQGGLATCRPGQRSPSSPESSEGGSYGHRVGRTERGPAAGPGPHSLRFAFCPYTHRKKAPSGHARCAFVATSRSRRSRYPPSWARAASASPCSDDHGGRSPRASRTSGRTRRAWRGSRPSRHRARRPGPPRRRSRSRR